MTLAQLRARLKEISTEMRSLNDSVVDEKGSVRKFTEEEDNTYSNLKAQAEEVRSAIARLEEIENHENEVRAGSQIVGVRPEIQILRNERHDENGNYRGFKSIGEQLQIVERAAKNPSQVDKRLFEVRAAAGMSEGVDSDGGFLVQSDFIVELEKSVMENASLARFCGRRPIGANSNGTSEPMMRETSRADGSRNGGARAYWEGEADQLSGTKIKFDELELKLKKLGALCVVTDDLLSDAVQLSSYIQEVYQEEMGFKLDAGIFEGTGAGMPIGFANSGAVVEVAKKSGQTADTIVAENVTAMFAAATPRTQSSGVWLINPEGVGQLPLMTIGQQPVFLPQGGLTGGQYMTLLGRPVIVTEVCEKLGDSGDFWFVDLKAYRLIEKSGIETAQSIHVYFDTMQTAFRFTHRINGAPRLANPVTPYKANTNFKVSPFVKVAARA